MTSLQPLLQEKYIATSTACPPPTPTNVRYCARDSNCRSSSISSVFPPRKLPGQTPRNRHCANNEAPKDWFSAALFAASVSTQILHSDALISRPFLVESGSQQLGHVPVSMRNCTWEREILGVAARRRYTSNCVYLWLVCYEL